MTANPTPDADGGYKSRTATGPDRPPGSWSARTVRLAVRALPPGPDRERYRQEFLAELHGMSRARQWRHAVGVLVRARALRSAIAARAPIPAETALTVTTPNKPLLCRTNVHHKWGEQRTSDGERYQCCVRCGKDRTDYDAGNFSATGKVASAALGQLGGVSGGGTG